MKTPLIFDIKRASTTDGPGIRTVLFFKGCNLDCHWCHNPEGKSPAPQIAYFREKCCQCGTCEKICDRGRDRCTACGKCTDHCPTAALKLYGKAYSIETLMRIIEADKQYYDATDGGVTFSGGECMLYPEYIARLAKLCTEKGIKVAIDTAGNVPYKNFQAVLPYTDLFLYDIKCIDPTVHKQGTGKTNERILQNLDDLIKTGKRIIIRVPVIPDFNADKELNKITEYCKQRNLTVEFLPYHSFGEDKKNALTSIFHTPLKT